MDARNSLHVAPGAIVKTLATGGYVWASEPPMSASEPRFSFAAVRRSSTSALCWYAIEPFLTSKTSKSSSIFVKKSSGACRMR